MGASTQAINMMQYTLIKFVPESAVPGGGIYTCTQDCTIVNQGGAAQRWQGAPGVSPGLWLMALGSYWGTRMLQCRTR